MARENRPAAAGISNQEVLAEINLITQIQQIETRLAFQPNTIRFAQLADAYLSIGEFEHAIQACEEGLKIYPYYDTATFVLAKAYYRMGDKKKARAILQEFLASNPAHLAAHKLFGDLSLEEDDVVGSVTHYRIALRMDPINRPIIQSLVDLKESYQKIKAAKSSDEDEEEDVRPLVQKREIPKAEIPKPISDKAPVQPKIEKQLAVEEKVVKPEAIKKEELKPVEQNIPVSAVEEIKPVHNPAYTDEKGVLYFYDDDEVSFEEYKQRQAWQKSGKAVIMVREALDAMLAEIRAKSKPPEAKKPAVSETQKVPTSFEEHLEHAMSKEEDELLSEADQEAALAEMDISYKDYLELLTEESDLLEALFQEEEETGDEEISPIAGKAAPQAEKRDDEKPMAYQDYVEDLTDESEIIEATMAEDHDDSPLSLAEFSEYLDTSDDVIDFATYALISRNGDLAEIMKDAAPADGGSGMSYKDYFSSLTSDAEQREAAFETTVLKPAETKDTAKAEPKADIPRPIPEKVEAIKEDIAPPPVRESAEKPAESIQPVQKEAAEEQTEWMDAEDINPQDATLELVEKLAAQGQYGTAYKVCKMLKAKNPTDAKIDRKILELKRLYLWSSQLVG
jgi:FimV-like protein